MKNKYSIIIVLLISTLFIFNCSEVKDDITEPAQLEGVHAEDFNDLESDGFHGLKITDDGFGKCQSCHAKDFQGGITDVSCVTCHETIEVHKTGINSPDSPNFHGKFFAENKTKMAECSQCHGDDFSGGISSPSCSQCHMGIQVHKEGIINLSSPNFHSVFIQETQWDLTLCSQCHGTDFSGSSVSSTCNTCHSGSAGPESCNTCHGDFADETRIAPPTDLANNFYTTARGVGAHSAHVYETKIALGIGCYDCHPGDASEGDYILTHSDGPPAEMSLADGSYDAVALTCSDTYCHGNFDYNGIKGNNYSPVWNLVDGTQAACGTCHGKVNGEGVLTPTPVGHFGNFSADQCKGCHPDTFNEDGSLNPFIHMNGEANVN